MKRHSERGGSSKPRPANPLSRREFIAPRTMDDYFALTEEQQDLWLRYLHVVAEVRAERASLSSASRASGIDPITVVRMVGSALRKNTGGQYKAKPSDRLLRVLAIPMPEGVGEIATRDSREASRLATYWDYVQVYLQTGDASGLLQFEGAHITDANGAHFSLLTNLDELDRLGSAGELSFESIYMGAA